MKREKTDKEICEEIYNTTVKKIFPLFKWKECDSCHMKFRRESGWRYVIDTTICHAAMDIINTYGHLCKDCAPDFKVAYYIAESNSKLGSGFMGGWSPTGKRPTKPPPPACPPKPPKDE